jgi:hypothetical protein
MWCGLELFGVFFFVGMDSDRFRPELLSKVDAKFEKSGAPLRNIRSLMRVGMSMWKPKFKLLAK